jgi:hypothetical protein
MMPQHGILEILSPFTGPYRLPLVAIEVAAAAAVVVVVVVVVVASGMLTRALYPVSHAQ